MSGMLAVTYSNLDELQLVQFPFSPMSNDFDHLRVAFAAPHTFGNVQDWKKRVLPEEPIIWQST
jgi:hypothetical protein